MSVQPTSYELEDGDDDLRAEFDEEFDAEVETACGVETSDCTTLIDPIDCGGTRTCSE